MDIYTSLKEFYIKHFLRMYKLAKKLDTILLDESIQSLSFSFRNLYIDEEFCYKDYNLKFNLFIAIDADNKLRLMYKLTANNQKITPKQLKQILRSK